MNTKEIKKELPKYEAPAVIYDGAISTRAGSPIPGPGSDGSDPADLFGQIDFRLKLKHVKPAIAAGFFALNCHFRAPLIPYS